MFACMLLNKNVDISTFLLTLIPLHVSTQNFRGRCGRNWSALRWMSTISTFCQQIHEIWAETKYPHKIWTDISKYWESWSDFKSYDSILIVINWRTRFKLSCMHDRNSPSTTQGLSSFTVSRAWVWPIQSYRLPLRPEYRVIANKRKLQIP